MVKNQKLLNEGKVSLTRTPEESIADGVKKMHTDTKGTSISKKVEKIVDDILKGKTKEYYKSPLGKEKGLSEGAEFTEADKELLAGDELKYEATDEETPEEAPTEEAEAPADETGDEENLELEDDDMLELDAFEAEDEDEEAGEETGEEDGEETEEEAEDLTAEKDEEADEEGGEDEEAGEEDGEETEEEAELNIPDSSDDEMPADMKSEEEKYATEAEEIKDKVKSLMDSVDSEVMDEPMKESLSIMFEMYANAKAKAIAIRKTNTILNKVNGYLKETVETFVDENKKQINEAINATKKIALYEKMTHAINQIYGSDVLAESYKDEVVFKNVIGLQRKQVAEINKKLNEALERNNKLESKIIFQEATKEMTTLDRERLATIVESYGSFKDADDFQKKLKVIIENFVVVKKDNKTGKKHNVSEEIIKESVENKKELIEEVKEVKTETNGAEKVDIKKYEKFLG